jgi:competence protein ComEC
VIGRDIEPIVAKNKHNCRRGERWSWDGVEFEFLHPAERSSSSRNNHGCVLMVSAKGGRLLIAADIEQEIEAELIRNDADQLQAEVLIVPHHGSKTSSSQAFVDAVRPQIALIPVGYRNRYHHPVSEVVARYRAQGATVHYSGHVGAVKISFDANNGVMLTEEYRSDQRKYWNHVIVE